MNLELFGWIGGLCFAICGLPQAIKSYQQGHSLGISWGFLSLWTIGEVCMLIYIIPKLDWPLIVNYIANLIFISVIMWYKIKPRRLPNESRR